MSNNIRRIRAYQIDLPLHEGSYDWSGGKSVSVFDSTVVEIETEEGMKGYGEVCPLGPVYLPSYAPGARAGITEIAPHLLGEDATRLNVIARRMDAALKLCEAEIVKAAKAKDMAAMSYYMNLGLKGLRRHRKGLPKDSKLYARVERWFPAARKAGMDDVSVTWTEIDFHDIRVDKERI